MELNREQIKKALEHCKHQMIDSGSCKPCPYFLKAGGCMTELIGDALALIKELTEENERLRAEKEVLEITEKDLRFRNKELQKCNEGLAKNIEELEIEGDKVREAYSHYEETTGLKQVRADTVRKMQERLKAEKFTHKNFGELVYVEDIDQIAKEMLEDKLCT